MISKYSFDRNYLRILNKKILKKVSIEMTPSLGKDTEDEYEAFTSNDFK